MHSAVQKAIRMATNIQSIKIGAGAFCFLCAWLYPYYAGGNPDALQQIFMLATLTAGALLIGLAPLSPWLAAAALAGALTMLFTAHPYWEARVAGAAGLLLVVLACHMGAQLQRKPTLLPWLLYALVAAAVLNAAQGLLQWFGLVGELYRWVVEPEQRGIAYGAFRQRNLFATFLCVGVVGVVWLVYLRRLTEGMAWFFLLILMLSVAASGSRTGVLEAATLAALAILWRKQLPRAVTRLMVGQLALLGLSMLFLPIAAGWHGIEFTSSASRVALVGRDARWMIWDNAIALIAERPWTGWGWREMGYARYVTLLDNRFDGLLEHAHNLPLQLALEFGLPVAVLVCGVAAWAIYRAKPWRIHTDSKPFAWVILLLIVGIHSMLEYPLWSTGFLFLAGLCVGYLLPITPLGSPATVGQVWALRWAKLSAVGLLVLSLVAWQQYAKVLLIYKTPFTNDKVQQRTAATAALAKASGAWLFQELLDFSTLGITEVTAQNAPEVRRLAEKLLHYSAEPRVIQPLLLSLWWLDDQPALQYHADRFCRAYPAVFQKWNSQPVVHPMVVAMKPLAAECRTQAF